MRRRAQNVTSESQRHAYRDLMTPNVPLEVAPRPRLCNNSSWRAAATLSLAALTSCAPVPPPSITNEIDLAQPVSYRSAVTWAGQLERLSRPQKQDELERAFLTLGSLPTPGRVADVDERAASWDAPLVAEALDQGTGVTVESWAAEATALGYVFNDATPITPARLHQRIRSLITQDALTPDDMAAALVKARWDARTIDQRHLDGLQLMLLNKALLAAGNDTASPFPEAAPWVRFHHRLGALFKLAVPDQSAHEVQRSTLCATARLAMTRVDLTSHTPELWYAGTTQLSETDLTAHIHFSSEHLPSSLLHVAEQAACSIPARDAYPGMQIKWTAGPEGQTPHGHLQTTDGHVTTDGQAVVHFVAAPETTPKEYWWFENQRNAPVAISVEVAGIWPKASAYRLTFTSDQRLQPDLRLLSVNQYEAQAYVGTVTILHTAKRPEDSYRLMAHVRFEPSEPERSSYHLAFASLDTQYGVTPPPGCTLDLPRTVSIIAGARGELLINAAGIGADYSGIIFPADALGRVEGVITCRGQDGRESATPTSAPALPQFIFHLPEEQQRHSDDAAHLRGVHEGPTDDGSVRMTWDLTSVTF